ncbi:MAG: hypothetical protein M3348_13550 [Acidobacteriota bacterium]|nr:hypothetical protein [Acidobacteriota bacterium]
MLIDGRVYLLPDGHEYVAVATDDRFFLYRVRPDYLTGLTILVALADGTVRERGRESHICRVDEVLDTGRPFAS